MSEIKTGPNREIKIPIIPGKKQEYISLTDMLKATIGVLKM